MVHHARSGPRAMHRCTREAFICYFGGPSREAPDQSGPAAHDRERTMLIFDFGHSGNRSKLPPDFDSVTRKPWSCETPENRARLRS